jgi:PAS domain S-box-containing protein
VLCAAQPQPVARTVVPHLTELFWALVFLGALAVGGIMWAAVVRRGLGRETESLRQREATLEAYYQELFENAHDIMFSHDLQGNLFSLNKAGERILGYTREEVTGLNLGDLVLAGHQARFQDALQQFQAGRPSHSFELEVCARDGRRVVLRVDLQLRSLPGKPASVQGLAWDITGPKQVEEALRESERRLRQSLEERVRLGQDLHDGIIQSLYAIGLGLEESRNLVREKPADAESRLSAGVADLNTVIRDVRNFIVGLEPEALKGREFKAALETLVLAQGDTAGTRFSFDVDPRAAERLDVSQATQLLQIAREALSNSVRHGRPRASALRLRETESGVLMEVRDDGSGFDRNAAGRTGFGLRNIEARARDLHGSCRIVSTPGQGTTISVEIPEDKLHGST